MLPRLNVQRALGRRVIAMRMCSTAAFNPLHPSVPITDLGLPVTPLPTPIPSVPQAPLDVSTLRRLHSLAALNPPVAGSPAEAKLLADLSELIGLMDLVTEVELDGDVGALLTEGMGELSIGERTMGELQRDLNGGQGVERGRELLEYATRRVGDYYGFKLEKRD